MPNVSHPAACSGPYQNSSVFPGCLGLDAMFTWTCMQSNVNCRETTSGVWSGCVYHTLEAGQSACVCVCWWQQRPLKECFFLLYQRTLHLPISDDIHSSSDCANNGRHRFKRCRYLRWCMPTVLLVHVFWFFKQVQHNWTSNLLNTVSCSLNEGPGLHAMMNHPPQLTNLYNNKIMISELIQCSTPQQDVNTYPVNKGSLYQ